MMGSRFQSWTSYMLKTIPYVLIIRNLRKAHVGDFTCHPEGVEPATFTFHVVTKETPKAATSAGVIVENIFTSAFFLLNCIRASVTSII